MQLWQQKFMRCVLCLAMLMGFLVFQPGAGITVTAQENLLQNGGFEGEYVAIGGNTALQVAPGWQPWYLPPPPDSPSSVNLRPDYQPAPARAHSGDNAQEYNTFFATHDAGLYQRVPISPGAELRFSVYIYVWSSATFENPEESIQPQEVQVMVGIDPTGGQDGDSEDIIWSEPAEYYDEYREMSVTATALSTAVTVFVRSKPAGAVGVNNIYVDDASLIQTGETEVPTEEVTPTTESLDTAEPPEETETTEPIITSTPTATEIPDEVAEFPNRLTYQVQSGDTVTALAQKYSSTVSAILAANGLSEDDFIVIGQVIVIPVPEGMGEPVTTPVTPTVTATPVPGVTPAATTAVSGSNPPGTHIVQPGETLYRIALQYNTTVTTLATMNSIINPDLLSAGTILQVPSSEGPPVLAATATPILPATVAPPQTTPGTHVVTVGDNLYRIALRYGVTVEAIMQANGLSNANLIFAGQNLVIP